MAWTLKACCLSLALAVLATPLEAGVVPPGSVHAAPEVVTRLIGEQVVVRPGRSLTVAIEHRLSPGWHTYWQNPGDSGEAMRVEWTLPDGAAAGPISWPVPERISAGPVMTYGYKSKVTFLSEISLPAAWPAGEPFLVAADVFFLVCSEICIPVQSALAITVPTGPQSVTVDPMKSRFAAVRNRLPPACPWPVAVRPGGPRLRVTLTADGAGFSRVESAYFFAATWGLVDHAGKQETEVTPQGLVLDLPPGPTPYAGHLSGVVSLTGRRGKGLTPRACRIDTGSPNPATERLN